MVAISYDPLVDPKLQVTKTERQEMQNGKKVGELLPADGGKRKAS